MALDFAENLISQALQRYLGEIGTQAIKELGFSLECSYVALRKQGREQKFGQGIRIFELISKTLLTVLPDKAVGVLAIGQE